ncbi:MAG: tetratricopeptide repeat protein [Acidobacteria bacterium]|nr:tetratricopeptide repeat protein [Acidobacteriota bacterium]
MVHSSDAWIQTHALRGAQDGRVAWIAVALAATTVAVFAPVWSYEFVSWDDPWYITNNPHVLGGLTWPNVVWAFTTGGDFYWHPLTWLSHMLDVSLYGVDAGRHHLTNLLLHVANTLFLFALLRQMTGARWRSAFVAALFAVHPLHVESVAWVAERKDVLSTFLWMVTLGAYLRYVRMPGWGRYLAVLGAFALGLAAKPMIVTLPLVLLLLDVWPLGRWPIRAATAPGTRAASDGGRAVIGRLLAEKVPLLVVALASGVATFIVQQQAGAIGGLAALPLPYRVSHAVLSYVAYLGLTIVPINLAAFYPYPSALPDWRLVLVAAAGLACAIVAAARTARTHPYVLVGVLWYLVTLFPVIGLFQAGDQLMADHFTYVPLIGVFLIASWGVPDLLARWRVPRVALATAAIVVVMLCAVAAHAQVRHWANSQALWTRAVEVTIDNHRAHAGLGEWLASQGRLDEAIGQYEEAIRIAPAGAEYYYNLGFLRMRKGQVAEAGTQYAFAVRLNPRHVGARVGLGAVLARQGKLDEAIAQYTEALHLEPGHVLARTNLGLALLEQGRPTEARRACDEAVRLDPASADARGCLGMVYARQGRYEEAAAAFAEAMRLRPGFEDAAVNLGVALAKTGRTEEAVKAFREALRINPANEMVRGAIAELTRHER